MKKTFSVSLWLMSASLLITGGAGCVSLSGSSSSSATTGPAGVFLSTNQGESWQDISLLPTTKGIQKLSDVSVFGFEEDPINSKVLYWLSRGNGLLVTHKDGESWEQSVEPVANGFVYSVAVNPEDACTIFTTNGRQVFKTTDCGLTWVEMYRETDLGHIVRSVALNPVAPHHVFVGLDNGDLLRSEDGGASWRVVQRFGVPLARIAFDAKEEGLMYMASRTKGLFRSKDGGLTWKNLSDKLREYPGALDYRRLFLYPGKAEEIFWVSKYGILTSRNAGEDWEPLNLITAPGSVSIYSFATAPHNDNEIYYTATANNRSTLYRSIDGGKNWVTRKLPTGQIPTALRVHPNNAGWIYVGFTIPPKN